MLKINILNVSLWVLGGMLVLVLLGVIIWRIVNQHPKNNQKAPTNKLKINSETIDLALSLQKIYDFQVAVNILFKNKFADDRYSAAPMIVANERGDCFIIANPITFKPRAQYQLQHNQLLKIKRFNKQQVLVDGKRYRAIKRYVASHGTVATIIYPYHGQAPRLAMNFVPIDELGSYIKAYHQPHQNDLPKLFTHFTRINLYKHKTTRKGAKNAKMTIF